jgi:hypothetical protein
MERDGLEKCERRALRNLCYNATSNQGSRRVKEVLQARHLVKGDYTLAGDTEKER